MQKIGSEKLKEIFIKMLRIRAFEERAIAEYRKGILPGFIHSSIGQEAIPSSVCAFLRDDDYILTTHRGHGDIIAKGAKFDKMMAELYAKETGYNKGRGGSMHIVAADLNMLGATAIVGAGVPIASGVALGCKMQNLDRVTVCFTGDAATCTGAFHEGIGLAAIWNLPVIFVVENNQYGMSTPVKYYCKLEQLSDRAKAYGILGITVDGNDAEAIAKVASEAIDRARKGGGPTLIDAITYRYYGHHMGDPGTSYRAKEEIEEWKQRDPIERLQGRLLKAKVITKSEIEEIQASINRELDEAVKFAMESPEPRIEDALNNIYCPSA